MIAGMGRVLRATFSVPPMALLAAVAAVGVMGCSSVGGSAIRTGPVQLLLYSVFRSGLEGQLAKIDNIRQAERYLPDNIYTALEDFRASEWVSTLIGQDVKERYADLKQGSADRCPRLLGTFVKAPEVQFHHDVYNQYLWNKF